MPFCAICHQTANNLSIYDCGHYFHGICINKWCTTNVYDLRKNSCTCPLCRKEIYVLKTTRANDNLELVMDLIGNYVYNIIDLEHGNTKLIQLIDMFNIIWENRVQIRKMPKFIIMVRQKILEFKNVIEMKKFSFGYDPKIMKNFLKIINTCVNL